MSKLKCISLHGVMEEFIVFKSVLTTARSCMAVVDTFRIMNMWTLGACFSELGSNGLV